MRFFIYDDLFFFTSIVCCIPSVLVFFGLSFLPFSRAPHPVSDPHLMSAFIHFSAVLVFGPSYFEFLITTGPVLFFFCATLHPPPDIGMSLFLRFVLFLIVPNDPIFRFFSFERFVPVFVCTLYFVFCVG